MANLDNNWQSGIGNGGKIQPPEALARTKEVPRRSFSGFLWSTIIFLSIVAGILSLSAIERYAGITIVKMPKILDVFERQPVPTPDRNESVSSADSVGSEGQGADAIQVTGARRRNGENSSSSQNGPGSADLNRPVDPRIVERIKHLDAGIDLMERDEREVDAEMSQRINNSNFANGQVNSLSAAYNSAQSALQRHNIGLQLQSAQADLANANQRIGELKDKRASLEARIRKADAEAQKLDSKIRR